MTFHDVWQKLSGSLVRNACRWDGSARSEGKKMSCLEWEWKLKGLIPACNLNLSVEIVNFFLVVFFTRKSSFEWNWSIDFISTIYLFNNYTQSQASQSIYTTSKHDNTLMTNQQSTASYGRDLICRIESLPKPQFSWAYLVWNVEMNCTEIGTENLARKLN